jgi:CheY-like chemotaxis protein
MPTALIIDDEPSVREALARTLETMGFAVRFAVDGIDGLNAYRTEPADLVITDIIMPRANGVETIRALRAEFPKVRILAISGGGNFGPISYEPGAITTTAYLAAAEKAGADAILTKPFDRSELRAQVQQLLEKN